MNLPKPSTLQRAALRRSAILSGTAASLLVLAGGAQAALLQNGSFESVSKADSFSIDRDGTLANWSSTPGPSGNRVLDCLVRPGDTTNLCGSAFGGGLTFWTDPGASPDGGNYVAIDGDADFANPLTQRVSHLVAGQQYDISFYQAAAQQRGYNGETTEQWDVKLGNESHRSTLMRNANHGVVPWMAQTLRFTASASSELLQFVALGTPSGQPPFVLLDGVSMSAVSSVPEPGSWALAAVGLVLLPAARRLARKSA